MPLSVTNVSGNPKQSNTTDNLAVQIIMIHVSGLFVNTSTIIEVSILGMDQENSHEAFQSAINMKRSSTMEKEGGINGNKQDGMALPRRRGHFV